MAYRETEKTRSAREQRRAALLGRATSLVREGGFATATVKAIADGCGVSVGTVYSYFASREALLAAVFRAGADRELEAVRVAVAGADGAVARLEALIRTFAQRAVRGRVMAWSLLFEPVDPQIEAERLAYRAQYHRVLHRILQDGIDAGEFPPQSVTIAAAALNGAISESLLGRLSRDPADAAGTAETEADERAVADIVRFCFHGVGAGSRPADTLVR